MNCFDNYIGLRGLCSDATPVSGYYINDMVGISAAMLSGLANEEQQNLSGIWDEIYSRSVIDMEGDILSVMAKYFKTNILLDNQLSGYHATPFETIASSDNLRGQQFRIIGSKFAEFFTNHIELYLNTILDNTKNNVYIYDTNSGELLDTISFSPSVGNNVIQINKTYPIAGQQKRIFICYDANLGSGIRTTDYSFDSQIVSTRAGRIATGSAVVEGNITFDNETAGLKVNFNIICSVKYFICSNRDFFKHALRYKLAGNIMDERLFSTRINKYTMFNGDFAKEKKTEYDAKYKENLEVTLNNLEPVTDGICFPCEKKRIHKYSLP